MTAGRSRAVEDLLNLGPASAGLLREAGIADERALRDLGAVAAYRRLKHVAPRRVSLVMLYALEGALTDRHWNELPAIVKDRLKEQVA